MLTDKPRQTLCLLPRSRCLLLLLLIKGFKIHLKVPLPQCFNTHSHNNKQNAYSSSVKMMIILEG